MDQIPTITFTNSPETEVDRIFVTARSIYNNFYPGNRFIILPYLDVPGDTSRVVMPNLDYSQIKNFWQRVGKLTRDIPTNPHVKLFNELKNLYQEKKFPPIDQKLIQKKEAEWKIHEKEFWMFIKDIFPSEKKRIKEIEVRLTNFGTITSISYLPKSEPFKLYIYMRSDANVSHLASIIIKIFLQETLSEKYSWRERMGIADFLMTNSKLKDIFPQHQHIVKALDNVEDKNFVKSKIFLQKIGAQFEAKPLELLDNKILSFGTDVEAKFTKREIKILKEMLRKKRLLEFNEVADILWDDLDDFSLQAMNKAMQRIRSKLIKLGLPNHALMTKRKQGYYLNT